VRSDSSYNDFVLITYRSDSSYNDFVSANSISPNAAYTYSLEMETISGKQKGTFIYIYDGYIYNIDKRIKNTYRCSSRRSTDCPGVVKITDGQVTKITDGQVYKLYINIRQISISWKNLNCKVKCYVYHENRFYH